MTPTRESCKEASVIWILFPWFFYTSIILPRKESSDRRIFYEANPSKESRHFPHVPKETRPIVTGEGRKIVFHSAKVCNKNETGRTRRLPFYSSEISDLSLSTDRRHNLAKKELCLYWQREPVKMVVVQIYRVLSNWHDTDGSDPFLPSKEQSVTQRWHDGQDWLWNIFFIRAK